MIQTKLGVPWWSETVDTFKAGNPDTAVRGIATTVMATMSVLERAAAAGRNFIISHEPTFYGHTDATAVARERSDLPAQGRTDQKNTISLSGASTITGTCGVRNR